MSPRYSLRTINEQPVSPCVSGHVCKEKSPGVAASTVKLVLCGAGDGIPGSHVKWCVDAYQPAKYFRVSQMALQEMKVQCDGTSSSGGIKGSCMMKMTTKIMQCAACLH